MSIKQTVEDVAYFQGRKAYSKNLPVHMNPYPSGKHKGHLRRRWYFGWYDEWRLRKYGPNQDENDKPLEF